jgi:hypothetical protein
MNSEDMTVKNKQPCSEIEDIQRQLRVADKKQMHQKLLHFVESHSWSSLLLFRSLYEKDKDLDDAAVFLASEALEAIDRACGEASKPGKPPTTGEGEEAQLFREQLDELLIAMAFLVFTFDSPALRKKIRDIDRDIARRIRRMKRGFLDGVPLGEYLDILERKLIDSDEAAQPLSVFLYELLRRASSNRRLTTDQEANEFGKCVESLISEAGRRIEKPDRLFSYADTLDFISRRADSWFDVIEDGDKRKKVYRFSKKYKWAYRRGRTFSNLNRFWAACIVGLSLFIRALDRFIASSQTKVPNSSKAISRRNQDYGEGFDYDRRSPATPNAFFVRAQLPDLA